VTRSKSIRQAVGEGGAGAVYGLAFGRRESVRCVFSFVTTLFPPSHKMSSLLLDVVLFAQTTAPASPAPAPGQSPGGSPLMSFLPMILLFAAMYFLMIAPQRKKQKEHEKMLKALESGDEIVTSGGIYGTISNVKEDRFVVRIADNTKIEIGKGFVQAVVKKGSEEKK
jgi:preprotein translocase subunit YajC